MFGLHNKLDTGWLAGLAFFQDWRPEELRAVSNLGERQEVAAGTVLIDQGRVGDACYVIVDGTAAVYMQGEFVTTVGAGSMVGEMALIEHRPRNATVVADTDMVLVSFGTREFQKLLDDSPHAKDKVSAMLEARLRANEERRNP